MKKNQNMNKVQNIDLKEYIKDYYSVYFGINAIYECWAKAHGLTSNILYILYVIHQFPNQCTQRFICDKLQFPKQTVNTILDSFEKDRYIQKEISALDKRTKYIMFTEEGQKYADNILADLLDFEESALNRMDSKDRTSMLRSSQAFLTQLSEVLESTE